MTEFEATLQKVADKFGVTPEEVYRDMQEAINVGVGEFDPAMQAMMDSIPYKGDRLTPEEAIMGIAAQIRALESRNLN